MSIPNKLRFSKIDVNFLINTSEDIPTEFIFENKEYSVLGISNKQDLIPVNLTDQKLQKAAIYGSLHQYIAESEDADLYDVVIYQTGDNKNYLYGIRTRQKPDKEKKGVNEEE